ncbi:MAG: phage tail tip lysozyme [Pseudonocardiaceae bacterium]
MTNKGDETQPDEQEGPEGPAGNPINRAGSHGHGRGRKSLDSPTNGSQPTARKSLGPTGNPRNRSGERGTGGSDLAKRAQGAAMGARAGGQIGGAYGAAAGAALGALGSGSTKRTSSPGTTDDGDAERDASSGKDVPANRAGGGMGGLRRRGAVLGAATVLQPLAQGVLLVALLNWLKSMFFMLAATALNLARLLWALVATVSKAVIGKIVGVFAGVGQAASSLLGFGPAAATAFSWAAATGTALVVTLATAAIVGTARETTAREGALETSCKPAARSGPGQLGIAQPGDADDTQTPPSTDSSTSPPPGSSPGSSTGRSQGAAVAGDPEAKGGQTGSGLRLGEMPEVNHARIQDARVRGSVRAAVANLPERMRNGRAASIRALIGAGAEVIALNEVPRSSPTQLAAMAPGFGAYKDTYTNIATGGGKNSLENAVLWSTRVYRLLDGGRFQYVENDWARLNGRPYLSNRYATWVVLERKSDHQQIVVVSTHHMTNPRRYPSRAGHKMPQTRMEQYEAGMGLLRQMITRLSAYGPVLVAGDMNTRPRDGAWSALPQMRRSGYTHTRDHGVVYQFVPGGAKATHTRLIPVTSDHSRALLTTIRLGSGRDGGSPGSTPGAPTSEAPGTSSDLSIPGGGGSTGGQEGSESCCPPAESSQVVTAGMDVTSMGAQQTLANAKRVYGVFKRWGMPEENIAGVLGNWSQESGIDPTAVEGIGTEPFRVGARKQAAIDAGGTMGIGLGQWTATRNTLLQQYAAAHGRPWSDLATQVAFMATGDNPGDVAVFNSMISTRQGTPAQAAVWFHHEWERSADDATGVAERSADAERWYALMSRWDDPSPGGSTGNTSPGAGVGDSILDLVDGALPEAVTAGLTAAGCDQDGEASFAGLRSGGLDPLAAQQLIDLYLREGDRFLDIRYGDRGGPGSCGSDHAANCKSFSTYFMNKYTSFGQYAPGDGMDTAGSIARMTGKTTSKTPSVYSVFSSGSSAPGHTGVVLGVQGDTLIIGEAHYCAGRGNTRMVPATVWRAQEWTFVDVSDLITDPAMGGAA